ncbi:MAG: hypothetical protein HFJ60_03825 [Clostridia bacterium]|jgi:hypothetical protein|nr:hypothetical protein [Clostridia bacterium]
MRKLIIIDQDGNEAENNIINELFQTRYNKLEGVIEEREKFIKENNLNDITQSDIINKIENIPNVSKTIKKQILKSIDKLLDNRLKIQTFDSELYYKAGVNDIIDIIFCGKIDLN